MSSQWETEEDFERDLFEYSHLEYPGDSMTPAPPKSISEYRARTQSCRNPGLFDEEPEYKEIFLSGRGKHHPGQIIRPGEPAFSTPEEDMDIRRKIREVSGPGYSNELIEQIYRQGSTASDEEEDDGGIVLPNLKLRPGKRREIQKIDLPGNSSNIVSPKHSVPRHFIRKGGRTLSKSEKKETKQKKVEEIEFEDDDGQTMCSSTSSSS